MAKANPLEQFLPIDPLAGDPAPAGWSSQPQQQLLGKDDDEDDDDDEDEDEDPDAGKTRKELRDEVKRLRAAQERSNKDGSRNRRRRKELAERVADLEAKLSKASKPGASKTRKTEDDAPDVEAAVTAAEARVKAEVAKERIADKAEARLLAMGVSAENADLLVGRLDYDDLELVGRDVDGLDEAIEGFKAKYPTMFAAKGKTPPAKRRTGEDERSSERKSKPKTATERQAAALRGE